MEDGGNCRTNKGVLLQLTRRPFSSDCFLRSLLTQAFLLISRQSETALISTRAWGGEKRELVRISPYLGDFELLSNRSFDYWKGFSPK